MSKWIEKLTDTRFLVAIFCIAIVFFTFEHFGPKQQTAESDASFSPDTVIPQGHVLIPIAISNIESLSSLVGGFAVVDLFTAKTSTQKGGLKVISRVKLVRAPLNPEQYAALLLESESRALLEKEGPYFVVIQNPSVSAQSSLPLQTVEKKKVEVL